MMVRPPTLPAVQYLVPEFLTASAGGEHICRRIQVASGGAIAESTRPTERPTDGTAPAPARDIENNRRFPDERNGRRPQKIIGWIVSKKSAHLAARTYNRAVPAAGRQRTPQQTKNMHKKVSTPEDEILSH